MILSLMMTLVNSSPLQVKDKDFMVTGTSTVATFVFDTATLPKWTILFSSFDSGKLTGLVGLGLTVEGTSSWIVYQ
jgi:hypothetical protein